MASLVDLSTSNLSYYSVVAAFVLLMVSNSYASLLAGKNMDHNQPRKTEEHCMKDTTFSKTKLHRFQRAKAAAANGNETIGYFAAAVVAANTAGVSLQLLNTLSLGYVASRVMYNFAYIILQDNARLYPIRSLAWVAGIAQTMALFIIAGNTLNAAL